HDCADGGFAVALAESCFSGGGGAVVDVPAPEGARDAVTAALFSESASRAIVATAAGQTDALVEHARALGVPATVIGRTGGERITIRVNGTAAIDMTTAEAEQVWNDGLSRYFKERVA